MNMCTALVKSFRTTVQDFFYRQDVLPETQPTVSNHLRNKLMPNVLPSVVIPIFSKLTFSTEHFKIVGSKILQPETAGCLLSVKAPCINVHLISFFILCMYFS